MPVILASITGAAQDSTGVTTLKAVVVSASRMEQPVVEVPRSVTVIGAETIRNSVYQSVGELLSAHSGLFVAGANQTPGTNQNIFMRGTSSNQVAVLIDGVRITDPTSPNAAIDFSEISLTNVARIEVIRGSHSTLFGGAAVGGVINIIMKHDADPGFHGDASWQGGTFGSDTWSSAENVNLSYGMKSGFYASGSLFRQDVAGLDASADADRLPSPFADRDDFRKMDGLVRAGYRSEAWDASVSFKNVHQYTEIDDGALVDDENSYLEFDRRILQYAGSYKFGAKLELSIRGSYNNSERFYEDDSSRVSPTVWDHVFSTGTYYGRLQTHEGQLNFRAQGLYGVIGSGLYREKMFFDNYILINVPQFPYELATNYDSLDTRTATAYAFTRVGHKWGSFDVSAGGRYSHHTEAGGFFTFEVNPSYSFDEFLIYGSLSTGFNPPSLYQLYDPSRSFNAFATRGNSDLKPEQSVSLEAGIKKQFPSGSFITMSAYRTNVTNGIEYVYLWNGEKDIADLDFTDDRGDRYINIGEQEVAGVEVEGLIVFSDALALTGNVSLLEAEVRAAPGDLDLTATGGHHVQIYNLGKFLERDLEGSKVVRRPSLTGFAKLTWRPVTDVSVQGFYRYTGNRYDAVYDGSLGPYGAIAHTDVDEYHLVDLGASWRASELLSIALKVENVFDEKYHEVVGFQTRGRSLYLKVGVRF